MHKVVAKWRREIELYEKEFDNWTTRGDKIVKRFRDDRDSQDDARRQFSLLYANTETVAPVLYGATPKAVVSRRNKDDAPAANLAAELAQRALNYLIERNDMFDDAMLASVQDYQLPGRGQAWCRYEAQEEEYTPRAPVYARYDDDGEGGNKLSGYLRADDHKPVAAKAVKGLDTEEPYIEEPPAARVASEDILLDYIDWHDFGHTAGARTWNEVDAVWKHTYLTRKELVKRFGAIGRKVTLDLPRKRARNEWRKDAAQQATKRATVTEIWCKSEKRTIWIAKGYDEGPLEIKENMYELQGFFPCPKPLLSLTTNEQLVPVPDYAQYQDQAEEMDGLTERIALLQKSLRARGLYPGSLAEIKTLLAEAMDTELVPVGDWASLVDKGGLKDAVHWFPVQIFAEVIKVLVEIRQKVKEDAYEVTGISDIIRGQSVASETATAQDIKSRWGSIRVRKRQQAVQRFVRATLQNMFDLMCNRCGDETILAWSDAEELNADPQALQDALALLRDQDRRRFKIDIETDSTVLVDEQAEKAERTEFLSAIGTFFQSGLPLLQAFPMLAPVIGELLLFTVRSFRPGSQMEPMIKSAMQQLVQMATAPKPPQPDPAAQAAAEKAKAEAAATQMKTEADIAATQAKTAADIQATEAKTSANLQAQRAKMAGDVRKQAMDAELKQRQMAQDSMNADADRRAGMQTKIATARIVAKRKPAGKKSK